MKILNISFPRKAIEPTTVGFTVYACAPRPRRPQSGTHKDEILKICLIHFRFDDHLKAAIKLNLRGTKEILELATEVRNLEVS